MSRKKLLTAITVVALAIAIMIIPSFAAKAQDVMCTITGVNVYIDHAELKVANCNAVDTAKLVKDFQAELGQSSAEKVADTDATPAAQPIEEATAEPTEEAVDTIPIPAKGTETIPAGYWVSGDVAIDGTKLYDDKSDTKLIVIMNKAGEVYAEWGATATNKPLDVNTLPPSDQLKYWSGTDKAVAADAPQGQSTNNGWTLHEYPRLSENPIVVAWIARLREPAPELWPTFPNIPNPLVPDFRVVNGKQVPDGVEYGVANVPFCQQDQRCDFIVPARHYRLISADYKFQDWECRNTADDPKGCLLILINVMDQSYTWRNQTADNGFTVAGRYWDGDNLEWGVWGLVSHAAANMLNMPTMAAADEALNFSDGANAGANCGTPQGCKKVEARVVVHAGDEILAVLETTITR